MMFDRYITHAFLNALSRIDRGGITIETPDGKRHSFQGAQSGAQAHVILHDWNVARCMIQRGDIGLAETYRDGRWDSPDPSAFFLFGLQNQDALAQYIFGNLWGRLASRMGYLLNRNTLRGSSKNIQAHYDLGNDFYALWLDPSMTYSSALFHDPQDSLQQAQHNKYDRILDRLDPSGRVLEIGCGWGGFMERALTRGDYTMKGLTLSPAQQSFAQKRLEHLGNNTNVALEDYRHQKDRYHHIVSIEMFEAVGEAFWPVYFSKIKTLLAEKGKAVIQTITVGDAFFDRYRQGGDAIRTFIFPGGMLPSPQRFRQETEKAGLKITDAFSFGQDYAVTLNHWLVNFENKLKEIKAMGFDDKFIRLWRFYLTCCIAAFRNGRTDVVQWELRHA